MYSWENPGSWTNPEICGKWEIVEDIDRQLSQALEKAQFPRGIFGDD